MAILLRISMAEAERQHKNCDQSYYTAHPPYEERGPFGAHPSRT